MPTYTQDKWTWCDKCQGLFFAGHGAGICAAGGGHASQGSGNYILSAVSVPGDAQDDWSWCSQCQGLWFGGNLSAGVCPASSSGHKRSQLGDYLLSFSSGQKNWRWCSQCQGLWFAGNNTPGVCPSGGGHNSTSSGNYGLLSAGGQDEWRWCSKCQGLFFAVHSNGTCPAGGMHDPSQSGNYSLTQFIPTGQIEWRWCNRCQGLWFAGNNTSGVCPMGPGGHSKTSSGNYVLPHSGGQDGWRWCSKCQGLFFDGQSNGMCPAGGMHAPSQSGNYSLSQLIQPATAVVMTLAERADEDQWMDYDATYDSDHYKDMKIQDIQNLTGYQFILTHADTGSSTTMKPHASTGTFNQESITGQWNAELLEVKQQFAPSGIGVKVTLR